MSISKLSIKINISRVAVDLDQVFFYKIARSCDLRLEFKLNQQANYGYLTIQDLFAHYKTDHVTLKHFFFFNYWLVVSFNQQLKD